ncbi:MAG: PHP domain-containing protein [Actinomycetes bacterium]
MRIDLHTHSTASDGTGSPADVVAEAAREGLDVVALTDHDTTAGWREAQEAALELGVVLVPGTEVSCSHHGISVHLLSYLQDPDDERLGAEMRRARESRETRAERMVERIAADYPLLSWEAVLDHTGRGATIGRPHIADALVAVGYFSVRDEVFATVLNDRSPYYVSHYAPDPVTAVRLVRQAGGVPVFAHPLARSRGRVVGDDVIEAMVDAGLAGLEVDHRDHTDGAREHLRGLARRWDLVVTGSSDYHGTGKVNRLGENTTAPDQLDRLLAQATGARVVHP